MIANIYEQGVNNAGWFLKKIHSEEGDSETKSIRRINQNHTSIESEIYLFMI